MHYFPTPYAKHTSNKVKMEPVVHTSFPSFSTFLAPYKLPLFHSQYSLQRQGSNHTLAPPLSSSSSSSLSAALTMEIIKSRERRQVSIEKVRRYSTVEVEDEEEEEDESVAGLAEDERKKGVGRRGGGSSGGVGGVSLPSCQAEMCGADLTVAKRYHRRHKVCELHSKAPSVMIAGLRQRFCQQCSRFHELAEFDEAKRSCRRRLARHNERRRKSNAETCISTGSKEQQHHAESLCRNADDWGRIQMSIANNSAYNPFHIS